MAGIRLSKLPLSLYKIYDTKINEYWETSQGKLIWTQLNHAKSAWTTNQWKDKIKFNDQERYKIVKFTVPMWINEGFLE